MKKIIYGILSILALVVLGTIIVVNLSWQKDYSEAYPVNFKLSIEADSAMLARGKYLTYGPAHCAHCHVPIERLDEVEKGIEVPLIGGFGLEIPPGKFYAPNITPDIETGIGDKTDGELYRMLRHNIRPNGMATVDFMPFINMSDQDVYSIIAYIKSVEPVKSEILNTEFTFIGKAMLAMEAIKPGIPDEPIPKNLEKEATIAYGQYLAYAVANCRGCHTNRDMKTGAYIGPSYAGGLVFSDNMTNGWVFKAPNLTNDPETGFIYTWSEEEFIKRMRGGRIYEYSPMPWAAFAMMDDVELKALYLFLKSLDLISNKVETTAIAPEG